MLRYKNLSSGSTGNATLVEASGGHGAALNRKPSRVLVDCGMRLSRLLELLALADVQPADIDAIFITHEHSDHIGCVTQLHHATAFRDGRAKARTLRCKTCSENSASNNLRTLN